ncbi:helix-turn-helix domain-containing protein [Rhizobium deserti]|nr:helix-turn-helix domain-containing protein [Rhizobium deserti]
MLAQNEKAGGRLRAAPTGNHSADTKKIPDADAEGKTTRKVDLRIAFRKRLLQVRMSGACFQVALCLSDVFADNETLECFPSYAAISKHTGLSTRAIQDAILTLKNKGFVATKRRGFSTSLLYALQVPYPADSRVEDEKKGEPVSGSFSCSYPADSRGEEHGNLPPNKTAELDWMSKTEDQVLPSCPPADVVAQCAPPLDLGHSSLDLAQPATVVGHGQPSDDLGKREEKTIRAPANPRDRVTQIQELKPGISVADAKEIAEWWQQYPRTLSEIESRFARELGAVL